MDNVRRVVKQVWGYDALLPLQEEAIGAVLALKLTGTPLSVCVFDAEGLSDLNRTRGYAAGDAALRRTAAALLAHRGNAGAAGRIAGDAFGLLLPGSDGESARRTCQDVLQTAAGQTDGLAGLEIHLHLGPFAKANFVIGAPVPPPASAQAIVCIKREHEKRRVQLQLFSLA